ncbi:hypothetical protein HY639_06065 [Candidatus Woesearchaeota archaeon]|nr:hypothetical protein [Candidatus Woesearchaeota archaeon]
MLPINQTIAKDTPLIEVTLRRYEKPMPAEQRDMVRKLCLSLGLLQPGDSRDVIIDVLCVLLHHRRQKMDLSSEEVVGEVIAYRKKHKLPLRGVASSNVRRQLRRLRELMLVEKLFNNYRIIEFSMLHDLFEEKVERFLLVAIVGRIKEYLRLVDASFSEHHSTQSKQDAIGNEEARHEGDPILN